MATQTLKLRMLEDRVLVKPMPQEDKTESGIYLPDSAKERPQNHNFYTLLK